MEVVRTMSRLAIVCLCIPCMPLPSQTPSAPPLRPRILFTQEAMPALTAAAQGTGVRAAHYAQMATSASLPSGSPATGWQTYWALRHMLECAVRWRIEGHASARISALNVLVRGSFNVLNGIPVNPSSKPFVACVYPAVVGATFDLLYDELTSQERAAIVQYLESWINATYVATAPTGSYASHSGSVDNTSFSWDGGLVVALLAIWGEPSTNRPDIPGEIMQALLRLESGWKDAVSPGGSYDEGPGYALYGAEHSIRAAIAARQCGFPDVLFNTNVVRMPRWYGSLLMGTAFPWIGDSHDSHRGVDFDPVLYHVVGELEDSVGLWCLERIRAVAPVSSLTTTFSWSPMMTMWLYYPEGLNPLPPRVLSEFFPDNLNLAPAGQASWNKTNNHDGMGLGGSALLHNSHLSSHRPFAIHYMIRDEWTNHGHEDDGHVDVMSDGQFMIIDRGYADIPTKIGAQSTEHNICTVPGGEFMGSATNYFTPPAPDGRYLGECMARLLSRSMDYVRGDHRTMWMMNQANRTVVMVKDPGFPYALIIDQLMAGSGNVTYSQRWNTATPMTGLGTIASPWTIVRGGQALRGYNLGAAPVVLVPGSQSVQPSSGIVYYPNRLESSSANGTTYVTLFAPSGTLQGFGPLTAALPGTLGGEISLPGADVDRIIVGNGIAPAGDSRTIVHGRFGYVRMNSSGVATAYSLGEGVELIHDGIQLVMASETISLAQKAGIVEISRGLAVQGTAGPVVRFVPTQPVQEVRVDGEPATWSYLGGLVQVGSSEQWPLILDRCYTFTDGFLWDAVLVGGAAVVNGRVTGGSDAQVRVGAGVYFPTGSLHLGASWSGPAGTMGSIRLNSLDGVVKRMRVERTAGGVLCSVEIPSLPAIPLGLIPETGPEVRTVLHFDAMTGMAVLLDRFGVSWGTALLPPSLTPFTVTAEIMPGMALDNLTVHDSIEDGVNPQGVALWVLPDGRVGICIQKANPMSGALAFSVNQYILPEPVMIAWLVAANFTELILAGPAPPPGFPSQLREMAAESAIPAALFLPGIDYGMKLTSLNGATLRARFVPE